MNDQPGYFDIEDIKRTYAEARLMLGANRTFLADKEGVLDKLDAMRQLLSLELGEEAVDRLDWEIETGKWG